MAVFCQLADPTRYIPCSRDHMLTDREYREHWIDFFAEHFSLVVKLAIETYGPQRAGDAQACRADFLAELAAIRLHPERYGELDLLMLDYLRQQKLKTYGLPDPFLQSKQRENAAMLELYPRVVQELDSHKSEAESLLLLIEGVFAGNIFDLGAAATMHRFASESPDFFQIRRDLGGQRPWLVDHFDALSRRILQGKPHRKAIFFIDNAGSDCLLGMLPLARWMARRGTQVIVAANTEPALNDMTYPELCGLMDQVRQIDPLFDRLMHQGLLVPIASGGIAPLIDLRRISDECNRQAADVDLVLLEGMGRSLESNYEASFRCDALKLCMIKEHLVAQRMQGKVFDVVCRFDPA